VVQAGNAAAAAQVRAEQFRFFAEALKTAKLKLYVPHFVSEAEVPPASYACLAACAVQSKTRTGPCLPCYAAVLRCCPTPQGQLIMLE